MRTRRRQTARVRRVGLSRGSRRAEWLLRRARCEIHQTTARSWMAAAGSASCPVYPSCLCRVVPA
eukprot:4237465-Prymnesium_polylepis.1